MTLSVVKSDRASEIYSSVMGEIQNDNVVDKLAALAAAVGSILEDARIDGLPSIGLWAGFASVVSQIVEGKF
jgi:hypothetical protein